jgi:hypothetical protein
MARRFVITGVVLLLVGVAVVARSAIFFLTSAPARGTVVAFVSLPPDHHAFRVRYEVDGTPYEVLTHTYRGELSAAPNEFREGQTLPIRYRPEAPAGGRVYDPREQLGPAALFLVPGLGLLLYGLFPQGATAGPLAKTPGRRRT